MSLDWQKMLMDQAGGLLSQYAGSLGEPAEAAGKASALAIPAILLFWAAW